MITRTIDTASPHIVYVAGYGRSGSTLLDIILGIHADCFGAGELRSLFHCMQSGIACSCGRRIPNCPVWSEVAPEALRKLVSGDIGRAVYVTDANEALISRRRDSDTYTRLWTEVFRRVSDVTGKKAVVDSSKSDRATYRRVRLLLDRGGMPVSILHLVRDPRAIMWSMVRGSNRRLEADQQARLPGGMARGLFSWIWINMSLDGLARRRPSLPMMRVRYEDLVDEPSAALHSIGAHLDLDMGIVLERLSSAAALDAGHGIAGNRMRRAGPIVLRHDREWEKKLPRAARAVSLLALPLMKRYGYA